jgi:hypothetical protein
LCKLQTVCQNTTYYLPRDPPLERELPPPLLPDDLLGALEPDEPDDLLGAL